MSAARQFKTGGTEGANESLEKEAMPQARAGRRAHRFAYPFGTLAAIIVFLLIWQYGPESGFLTAHIGFMNKFTISSPTGVWREITNLVAGSHGAPSVWPYLENTVVASLLGLVIGLLLGAGFGILFAESEALRRIFSPIVSLINSAPRIALIPIVVLIAGPTLESSVISSVLVVFFLAFFNALEGARSVPQAILDNSRLLGAGRAKMIALIRLPNALALIFASLPNLISFSLITVVTTEILTGIQGMGQLIISSETSLNSGLSLAVVVLLSVVGSLLVLLATLTRKWVLRWERLS